MGFQWGWRVERDEVKGERKECMIGWRRKFIGWVRTKIELTIALAQNPCLHPCFTGTCRWTHHFGWMLTYLAFRHRQIFVQDLSGSAWWQPHPCAKSRRLGWSDTRNLFYVQKAHRDGGSSRTFTSVMEVVRFTNVDNVIWSLQFKQVANTGKIFTVAL